ncbi:MAG: Glu-tRNA(Gln) amidotransferase subunit GatE [Candidatus Pacearchaeota archaeon]|jgi:glutamyl-tRNA(Gln) amidotransferase subunit E
MTLIKSGIEIHQQLDTNKLFCECPSILRSDNPKFEIKRRLHAVKGETGEVDAAAKHEAARDREFIYQGYDTTCLVELDEEPPHEINKEALKIGLQVALFLNCDILPITQIMRKTVVDGSNTSGFQRTVLIARNGYIDTPMGRVGIEGINLEEDAARIIERKGDKVVYRLDRLGIPLIEIGTKPDIKSPEQAKEVALALGDILRSCKVKRGLGTIRQDINISIEGHPRIEIKGFQDVKMFLPTIEKEVKRQQGLIEINKELKKRKASVSENIEDLSEIFKNTECKIIKKVIEGNGKVLGVKLVGFNGILGKEFYENRRFGTEISEYSKVAGIGGIIHSDEDKNKYNFSDEEIKNVRDKLGLKDEDSFIIVADQENKARKAIDFALTRARVQLVYSSMPEVRQANPDGSSSFLRPMPGKARMYPETDLPLLKISRELLNEVKSSIPKLRSEIRGELKQKGLSEEMIKLLSHGDKIEEFQLLLKIINDPNFIAKVLFLIPRDIASHENIQNIDDIINLDVIEHIVLSVKKGIIQREDIKHVMEEIVKGKKFDDAIKLEKIDNSEIEGEIAKLVKEKPGLTISGYMGLIMAKYKGKVNGKQATEILNKLIKK